MYSLLISSREIISAIALFSIVSVLLMVIQLPWQVVVC